MVRRSWKSVITFILIPGWAGLMLLVVSSLMVGHWVSLPRPVAGERLSVELESEDSFTDGASQNPPLFVFHFLYGECPCSKRVLNHIVSRTPLRGTCETIVLVGQDREIEVKAGDKGFAVDTVTPQTLVSKYGIESAPLLLIVDTEGTILYSGGYTSRKQGFDIQDSRVIRDIVAGRRISELPVYGCGVSKRLKDLIDPFRLKYANTESNLESSNPIQSANKYDF